MAPKRKRSSDGRGSDSPDDLEQIVNNPDRYNSPIGALEYAEDADRETNTHVDPNPNMNFTSFPSVAPIVSEGDQNRSPASTPSPATLAMPAPSTVTDADRLLAAAGPVFLRNDLGREVNLVTRTIGQLDDRLAGQ